jgi:hypothetical protein
MPPHEETMSSHKGEVVGIWERNPARLCGVPLPEEKYWPLPGPIIRPNQNFFGREGVRGWVIKLFANNFPSTGGLK